MTCPYLLSFLGLLADRNTEWVKIWEQKEITVRNIAFSFIWSRVTRQRSCHCVLTQLEINLSLALLTTQLLYGMLLPKGQSSSFWFWLEAFMCAWPIFYARVTPIKSVYESAQLIKCCFFCFYLRRLHSLTGHLGEISNAQFNWDCTLIVSGSMDKTCKVSIHQPNRLVCPLSIYFLV